MKRGLPKLLALMLADALAFTLATLLATAWLCTQWPEHVLSQLLVIIPFLGFSMLLGLYRNTWPKTKPELDSVREIRAQFLAAPLTLMAILAIQELQRNPKACSPQTQLLACALLPFALIATRHLVRIGLHIPKNSIVRNGELTVPHELTQSYGLSLPVAQAIKYFLEKTLALFLLILCSPLFALLAGLVKLTSAGPALYFSMRVGKGQRPFNIIKFRTMRSQADAAIEKMVADSPQAAEEWHKQFKLKDDPRITPLGKMLRKTSLDELPQLWNVLKGEMAIIGPRPIVKQEISKYGDSFKSVNAVKPGLTGLWQVSGRNDLTYRQRVNLDVYYVQHWSPWLDIYILLKTINEVLTAHGR